MRQIFKNAIIMVLMITAFMMNVGCPQNGNVNMFFSVGREVDQEDPKVKVTSPTSGGFIRDSDSLTVRGTCSDNIGVTRIVAVMFAQGADTNDPSQIITEDRHLDGKTDDTWEVVFTLSAMKNLGIFDKEGSRVNINVTAYDALANSGTNSLFLYVDNTAPKVSWTTPESAKRFGADQCDTDFNNHSEFEKNYSINKPSTIGMFHNGTVSLTGVVKDNYSVGSTYLMFYKKTKADSDAELFAVTPIINQTISAAMLEDAYEYPEESEIIDYSKILKVGKPTVNATPMAWSYNIDTNQLTESKGWFQVGICTKDEAGNETQQKFDDPSYMLIDQDADMPRNNFNFDKDATINVKGTVSGIAFDDDGVTHVYIAAVLSEEAEQFLNDNPIPSEWTSDRTETRVICTETASDTNSGSSIINWGFEVPVKGGNYIIYTVPVDNSGRWQENFTDMEFDGTYWTTFRVNCAADPVIVLDKQVDSDVIDDESYKNDGYWISGNFYDNEGVKSISAAVVQYNNDDLSGDNIITKVIYTAENEANLEETFKITKTDTTSLSTGQTVSRKYFSWRFDPSLFEKTMAFTQMKIKFTAIDDDYTDGSDGHYNEASIVLYGDTVRPNFSDVSPANNSTLTTDTTFDGWVWDNVGVTSLVMTGDNFTSRQFSKDSESAIIGEPEWDASAKKYKRYFRTIVTPADINYQATTITLTANDAVGNESTYTINIRQDSTAPIVEFDNPTPGSYLNANGTVTVKIIPHLIGGVPRNVKAVSLYVGTDKQDDISISDFEQSTNSPYAYTATFGVSAGEHSFDLPDGDTNIKVEVTDIAGNKGEGTLYFIVDTTSPTNMEVTSPELLDSATVSALTDNTADITMEDISYYLNNSVTFKGIGSDNYKVAKTIVNIYKNDNTLIGNVTIELDASNDLSADSSTSCVTSISGTPANWSIVIDTTKMNDGIYYLKISSADAAGNISSIYSENTDKRYFKVLQDADMPKIEFNQQDYAVVFPNSQMTGIAYDDDGFSSTNLFKYRLKPESENSFILAYNAANAGGTLDGFWEGNLTPTDSSTYSFKLPKLTTEDDWTLWILPIDKNGKEGIIYKLHLKVSSSDVPSVTITDYNAGTGGKESSGTFKGVADIISLAHGGSSTVYVSEIWYRITSSSCIGKDETVDIASLSEIGIDIEHRGKWYVKKFDGTRQSETDTESFNTRYFVAANGKLTIEAITVNNEGVKSAADKLSFMVDNESPTVRITAPSNNGTVDGHVTLSGTLQELGSEIAGVYISYYDKKWTSEDLDALNVDSFNGAPVSPAAAVTGKWYNLGAITSASYTHEFDTTKLTEGQKSLAVAAIDKLDNIGYAFIDVTVDQDNDRPIVTISNMDLTGKAAGTPIPNTSGKIIGSVYDDDGTPARIEYSLIAADKDAAATENASTGWKQLETYSTAFTIGLDDGSYSIYLRITDAKGTKFISGTTVSGTIKLKDSAAHEFGYKGGSDANTVIYTIIDTNDPVIFNEEFYNSSTSEWVSMDNLNSYITGGTARSTLNIRWKASDDNGIKKCKYNIFGETIEVASANTSGESIGYYTAVITLTGKTSGDHRLEITAYDNVDKTVTNGYTVKVDNTAPTVNITTPSAGTIVDKTITISGNASDNSVGLDKIYISYLTNKTIEQIRALSATDIKTNLGTNQSGKWTEVSTQGSSWSHDGFNTLEITDVSCDFVLAVAAIDKNDNIGIEAYTIKIDQDQDRPEVTFSNLNLDGMTSGNSVWHTQDIYGVVVDNDGTINSMYYSTDNTNWYKVADRTNNFTIPLYNATKAPHGLIDGENTVYVKVFDHEQVENLDEPFVSKEEVDNNAVRIKDGSDNKYGYIYQKNTVDKKNTILYLKIDTESPAINSITYYNYATGNNELAEGPNPISGAVFGGNNRDLTLNIPVIDTNGISSVTVTIKTHNDIIATGSASAVNINDLGNGTYSYTTTLPSDSSRSGNYTANIVVTDQAGRINTKSLSFTVDNTPPVITFQSPNAGTELYGSITGNEVRGTISDTSSIVSFKYAMTNVPSDNSAVYSDNIIEYIGSSGNWILAYDWNGSGSNPSEASSGKYHLEVFNNAKNGAVSLIDSTNDNAQPIYVWIKAIDDLGNESEPISRMFNILANANKPTIEISYPTGGNVGGTIRITGSTFCQASTVESVWLQIDPNYNGTFNENWDDALSTLLEDFTVAYSIEDCALLPTTVKKGIKASGNVRNWVLAINGAKEYNINNSNRTMAIRAFAIETTDHRIGETPVVSFTVDPNTPRFGDQTPLYLTNGVQTKIYEDGMWITGSEWKICGSIQDDSGITMLEYSYEITSNTGNEASTSVTDLVATNSANITKWTLGHDGYEAHAGTYDYDMNIPLPMRGDYGQVKVTLVASDNSQPTPQSSEQILTINYDKQKPVFTTTMAASGNIIKNSADKNLSKFEGTLTEEGSQSGFGRIAMYFTRKFSDLEEYIIDPMLSKGANQISNRYNVKGGGWITQNGLYGRELSAVIENSVIAISVSPKANNIRPGGLAFVGGVYYRITSVSETNKHITVDGTLKDAASTTVYFPVAQIIDNIANEDTTAMLDVFKYDGDGNPNNDTMSYGDGDQMKESVEKDSSTYSWQASINSINIYDGPVIVHFVAFDKAGNIADEVKCNATVRNNPPRIVGVKFGTDKNGDKSISDSEMKTSRYNVYVKDAFIDDEKVPANGKDTSGNNVIRLECPMGLDSSALIVKDKVKFIPQIVGGNGGLKYRLFVGEGGADPSSPVKTDINSIHSESGDIRDEFTIEKSAADMLNILDSDGEKTLTLRIYDKTELQDVTADIIIKVDAALKGSNAGPNLTISPFYWNSSTNHSVYPNDSEDLQGHIELADDLPPETFKSSNKGVSGKEIYDLDPKVSGIITIDGTADDDAYISNLAMTIPGFNGGAGVGKKFTIATRNNTTGKVETSGAVSALGTNNWACEVWNDFDDNGHHTVKWKFHWNSAAISTVTAKDVVISCHAANRGKSDGTTLPDGSINYNPVTTTDNTTRVDVVPYISKVYTDLAKNKVTNWSVYNRTALGHYPVQSVVSNIDNSITLKTTTSENVILYGFNINHSSAKIVSGGSIFTVGNANAALQIDNSTSGQLSFNVAKLSSGKLNLTVNGFSILNNINNNDANGSASTTGTAYKNWYNRQANGDTNNILTDDVEFDVWEFNDRAAIPINGLATGINMEINQITKMLNYAFANGGLYYSMGGNSNKTTAYSADNSYSSIYWAADWDTFAGPCVGFHVDDLGWTYSLDSGGDTNSSGSVDKWVLYTSRWGKGALGTGGTLNGTASLRLEEIGLKTGDGTYDYSLMKYRFLSPEMASSVSGNNTNLYLVYYDALTNQIRFRAGTFSGTTKQQPGGFTDEYTGGASSYYKTNNCQVIANGASDPFKTSASASVTIPLISDRGAGQYVDVAVVKNDSGKDVVCVVWYDQEATCLKYSYITDPIADWANLKGDATAKNWTGLKTVFAEGGEYCHIVADKNNHLHIAAYAGNGDVMYAYMDSYSSTPSTCTVDASGAVGEHLTLDVAVNAKGHSIPYIGYYTAAIKMPKYAYLIDKTVTDAGATFVQAAAGTDSNERYTGAWEVAVVPSPSRMTTNREDKVNIGVWKSAGVLTDSKVGDEVKKSSFNNTGSGYSTTNWSKTFGNGTSNGILGYQISTSSGSCLETAQMR